MEYEIDYEDLDDLALPEHIEWRHSARAKSDVKIQSTALSKETDNGSYFDLNCLKPKILYQTKRSVEKFFK